LLQTNKKWGALKESQKNWIHEQIRSAHAAYYEEHGRLPVKPNKRDLLLHAIYEQIEARGIWIPYGEFEKVACKAIARLNRRIITKQNEESNREAASNVENVEVQATKDT